MMTDILVLLHIIFNYVIYLQTKTCLGMQTKGQMMCFKSTATLLVCPSPLQDPQLIKLSTLTHFPGV